MKIILLIIMACGQPVEYVVNFPDGSQFSSIHVADPKVNDQITTILQTKPRIIFYKQKGICN